MHLNYECLSLYLPLRAICDILECKGIIFFHGKFLPLTFNELHRTDHHKPFHSDLDSDATLED